MSICGRKYSNETIDTINKLYESGLSTDEIAEEMLMPRSTTYYYVRKCLDELEPLVTGSLEPGKEYSLDEIVEHVTGSSIINNERLIRKIVKGLSKKPNHNPSIIEIDGKYRFSGVC